MVAWYLWNGSVALNSDHRESYDQILRLHARCRQVGSSAISSSQDAPPPIKSRQIVKAITLVVANTDREQSIH